MKQVLYNCFILATFLSLTHQNTLTTLPPDNINIEDNTVIEVKKDFAIQNENKEREFLIDENENEKQLDFNFEIVQENKKEPEESEDIVINIENQNSENEKELEIDFEIKNEILPEQVEKNNDEDDDNGDESANLVPADSKDTNFNYLQETKDLNIFDNILKKLYTNNEDQESFIDIPIRVSILDEKEPRNNLKEEDDSVEIDEINQNENNPSSFKFDEKIPEYIINEDEDEEENILEKTRKDFRNKNWKAEKKQDMKFVFSQLQRIETLVMSNLQLLLALSLFLLVAHFLILLNGAFRKSKYFYVRSTTKKDQKKQDSLV